MAVVKNYQQASEPTDLTPGTGWYKDDGKAYIRRIDLTWNYIGEWQLPNFHHLSLEGGTMLGPILGGHGLAPINNPAFLGTATLNAIDLADKQWVLDQLTALQENLNALISNQISGGTGTITIGNNIAISYGSAAHAATLALPVYADNTRAALSEVSGVLVSVKTLDGYNHQFDGYTYHVTCSVDSSLVVTCTWAGDGHNTYNGTANYVLICKR